MGHVITVPEAGIDYALYGDKTNVISDYIYQQFDRISHYSTELGHRVRDTLQNGLEWLNDTYTKYNVINKLRSNNALLQDNYIHEYRSDRELQNANQVMIRWIMANPTLNQLYENNDIEAYDDYVGVDAEYDQRRVTDGMICDNEDGTFSYHHYFEDLRPGDRELCHEEKVMILNTWDCIDWLVKTTDIDFTSKKKKKINR